MECDDEANAVCHVGLAVRIYDDVIVFSKNTNDEPPKLELFLNGHLTRGVRILKFRDGKEYRVSIFFGWETLLL